MIDVRARLQRHAQFLRFCGVGATGVVVNFGVFSIALRLIAQTADRATPWNSNEAAVLGWLVSVASNFALNDRWTFAQPTQAYTMPWPRRLARYYGSALFGVGLQLMMLNLILYALTGMNLPDQVQPWLPHLANLAGIGAGTIVNYLMSKRFVFRVPRA